MRLAVLSSHPIQYYGPLFRELARRVDLHVFFSHRATPEQQAAAGFGGAFDWDVDLTSGYSHSFLNNVAARPGVDHFGGCDTPEIYARLREGGFDALLVFGWRLKSSLQATFAAKRLGIPVLVRGDSQLDTPRSRLKRTVKTLTYPPFLRLFDRALYVGERSHAYYRHYGYPSNRLIFSPHCIDNQWFADRATTEAGQALRREAGIKPEAKVVLFAGKLLPFKRPLDVIECCAQVRAGGTAVEVMIAGSGQLEEQLAARAAETGTPLHRLGFRNQTAMPAAYAAADVLMLPSDGHETWGLVSNEALACGVPILVSDAIGCAQDLAGDGAAGRVFPLADMPAAAGALTELLVQPPSPQDIAARSNRYSLAAAADGVIAALSDLHPGLAIRLISSDKAAHADRP